MQTPGHALINLALLNRQGTPHLALPVLLGGVLPDVPAVVFYAWEKVVLGVPEQVIWGQHYHGGRWELVFDGVHSIPLLALAALLCWRLGQRRAMLHFASMGLHALFDLPVHAGDAHRHFLPFSQWRFNSPLSYWNPAFYGDWVAVAEIGMVLSAAITVARRYRRWRAAGLGAGVALLYLGSWAWANVFWSGA